MKIIISINTSWNIYNFRKNLVNALQREGHELIAVAPQDEYSEKIKQWGCRYIPVKMDNKGGNPFKDYKLLKAYKKIFKKEKPDVILQYTIKPNIYGTLAANSLNIPVINNVSGLGTIFLNPNSIVSKIGIVLYRLAFKYPYHVFFQNEDDLNLFLSKGLVNKKITSVLPGSGVDLEKFKPSSISNNSNKKVFLMVSRVLIDKGAREYAEAAKRLKAKYSDLEFQLLGAYDNSKGSVPHEEFDAWIKQGTINYLGTSDAVQDIVNQADCVVLPSYREGTSKTLLEALACGKPIVATNVPGCRNTVEEGVNGYLCEPKNSQSLAEAMEKIVKLSAEDLGKFGKKSRSLAEKKYDDKLVINSYLEKINGIHKNRI